MALGWDRIPVLPYDWKDKVALNGQVRLSLLKKGPNMPEQESEIQRLESQLPLISGSAFTAARNLVLASGQSVLVSEKDVIYRVFPDGRREMVKRIEPPTAFVPGSKFTLE